MKKIIVSLLMIAGIAGTASAKLHYKVHHTRTSHIPYALNPAIDHRYDKAYSAQWSNQAASPAPGANFALASDADLQPNMHGKTYYYSLQNFTKRGYYQVTMNAPYLGQDAPSYDGAANNAYRNLTLNNGSEPALLEPKVRR